MTHNSEDTETTKVSVDRRMDKKIVMHVCTMEYYSGHSAICNNMNETVGHYAKGNKPDTERKSA